MKWPSFKMPNYAKGEKGFAAIFLVIGAVVVAVIALPIVSTFTGIISQNNINSSISFLEDNGYEVLAQGEGYGSDFLPDTDSTWDIGAAANEWAEGHFDDIYLDGALVDLASPAQGQVIYYNGTKWVALAVGSDGYVLTTHSAGANPTWETVAGGSLPSGTQGDVLYYNGADWVVLAAGTDGYYLETNGAGQNPGWSEVPTDFPAGTQGDVLYYNGSNWVVLAAGSDGDFLETNGAGQNPSWTTVPSDFPAGTQGDILYYNGSNWVALGYGTSGDYLETQGVDANPIWSTIDAFPAGTQGDILYFNGSNWVVLGYGTSGDYLETQGVGANPIWSTADVLPSGTQGDVLYYNGSAWVVLAAGSSGDFLKTQGGGSNPIWDTAPSGQPRSVTYYIAANDATANEKANADLVCNGTNDQTDWGTAQTAVGAEGTVNLSSGNFNIDASIHLTAHFVGMGLSTQSYVDNGATVTFGKNGGLRDMYIEAAVDHAGVCVEGLGENGFLYKNNQLQNVTIKHKKMDSELWVTGSIGLQFTTDTSAASETEYIQACIFGPNVTIMGFDTDLYVYSTGTVTHQAWFNDNTLRDFTLYKPKTAALKFERTNDYGAVDQNVGSFMIEAHNAVTVDGFVMDMASFNQFNITPGDWQGYATGALIKCVNQARWNTFTGDICRGDLSEATMVDEDIFGSNRIIDNVMNQGNWYLDNDHTSTSPIIGGASNDDSLAFGMFCYWKADSSEWWQADADAEGTSGGIVAMCVGTREAGGTYGAHDNLWFATDGAVVQDASWSWTVGAKLYISTTSGELQEAEPSGTGDIQRIVAVAITATKIMLTISPDYDIVP